MKRILGVILATAMLCGVVPPGAACSQDKGKNKVSGAGYTIVSVKSADGYAVKISKNGVTYSTTSGALGVRFDKNSFRADDPVYASYKSVVPTDGGLVGTGTASSAYGTVISFEDYYSVAGDCVNVERKFTVAAAGEDLGFSTELKLTDENSGGILDSEWFIPSTHYITGKHTFSETSTRMYFSGSSLVVPADDVSVLMAARYQDGKSFSLLDTTPGYRENIIADAESNATVLYIDENINVPGIYIGAEEGKVSISHLYPSYVNKKADVYTWRLLPVKEGLTRSVSFSVRIGEEKDYAEVLQNNWRRAYERFGYADKRYAASDVYETLIDAIDRSYSASNTWGNIPMYMTNTDHYFPDSGFLYRNLELATLMLKEGRARRDEKMTSEAWTVIEDQLNNDRLDTKLSAYPPENSVYKRVLFDGLGAAVELYVYESKSGEGDPRFLSDLLNYIVDKAEKYKHENSAMALNFYMPLYKYQQELFVDYREVAQRILEKAYVDTEDYKGYYGGVESTNTFISVAEDYMILFRAFLDAYETDGGQKWLDKAIVLGDYLETYQMIQPFELNLIGSTGAEGYYLAFMGNERFLGHGYIFNNTQHGILDIANTSSVIDYYRLYEYTQDKHYLDFAQSKLYNSLLYVNMGDKVGYMDDLVHSAGKGFMNEFVGNSTFNSGYAEAGIRGAAHDSNIAWNVWQIVSVFEWFKENKGGILPEEMNAELTHNLAFTKYAEGDAVSPMFSAAKAVDGDENTCWKPAGDKSVIIDLNEFCRLSEVKISASSAGASATVSYSADGVNFTGETPATFTDKTGKAEINAVARYIKIVCDTEIGIFEIAVEGVPVFYETLSYEAEVIGYSGDSSPAGCLDESNYKTSWNAGATDAARELILDFGSKRMIFQTALKLNGVMDCAYRIEVSDDNVNYRLYAEETGGVDKLVFVSAGYAEARFVKLTLLSSSADNFLVGDFKVMGH